MASKSVTTKNGQNSDSRLSYAANINTKYLTCYTCNYGFFNHNNDEHTGWLPCRCRSDLTAEDKAAKKAAFESKARAAEKTEQWAFRSGLLLFWLLEADSEEKYDFADFDDGADTGGGRGDDHENRHVLGGCLGLITGPIGSAMGSRAAGSVL